MLHGGPFLPRVREALKTRIKNSTKVFSPPPIHEIGSTLHDLKSTLGELRAHCSSTFAELRMSTAMRETSVVVLTYKFNHRAARRYLLLPWRSPITIDI